MVFALANLLIGVGSSASFAPLIADISHWFTRRRGIAVAICASGNYLGGAIWPPIVQHLIETAGWRQTQIVIGIVCLLTMLPLAAGAAAAPGTRTQDERRQRLRPQAPAPRSGLHPNALFGLLCARRRRLLRRHVDAAGAYRRLLRRPRLRRGARRRDAVADAGLRHHQPHRLGLRRRPHRRPRRRC